MQIESITDDPNPSGLCMCGCGRPTAIATSSNSNRGLILGQHRRYIRGHNPTTRRTWKCRRCKQVLPVEAFDRYRYAEKDPGHHSCMACEVKRDRDTSTPVSQIDPGFGHWLAGFIDGEGSFNIFAGNRVRVCFAILLRGDDFGILEEAKQRTGIGTIRRVTRIQDGKRRDEATWSVHRMQDCVALVRILDTFPLRARKRRDYLIWRRAVFLLQTCFRKSGALRDQFAAIKAELESGRVFTE